MFSCGGQVAAAPVIAVFIPQQSPRWDLLCLFSKPGQTWLCPCTLRCQDSPLQTLEIKVVFSYQCWGLALVWGADAGPSGAQMAGEAESRQSLM